jgi:hypothetical protein
MEIIIICVVGFIIWMAALVYHIRRTDCSDTERILWTIILCTLNILGVFLYFFLGPKTEDERILSEQELKDKFNKGT